VKSAKPVKVLAPANWAEHGFIRVASVAPVVHVAQPLRNVAEIVSWSTKAAAAGASLVAFPELSITGYTCEDLFLGDDLLVRAEQGLVALAEQTASLPLVMVVGSPLRTRSGRRYNAAVVLQEGRIVGAVPKRHLPNYGEFYERRWFTPGVDMYETIEIRTRGIAATFDLTSNAVFDFGSLRLGIEICEDLWAPDPPSTALALGGANVIVNPSGSNELVAKADYRRQLVSNQSARLQAAYLYAGSGPTESTKDIVFGGHTMIAENGLMIAEGPRFELAGAWCLADVDLDRLSTERARNITWSTAGEPSGIVDVLGEPIEPLLTTLERVVPRNPFVPDDPATRDERAREIMAIQATGLARRLMAANSKRAVIGVSGGLDSTLALLVAVEATRKLGWPATSILGITMPGFGTTKRTRTAADDLMDRLGIEARTISINKATTQHFIDIGHDPNDHSVTYENAQARERTQILFDVANQVGGIVIGTGDLSELALGWCTYNADHMANYGVNAGVPKTLVRHLVGWYASNSADEATAKLLRSVLDTPVSPELLPPDAAGNIVQETEDVLGPYELHDFFLWHFLRNGSRPQKIRALAVHAFVGAYDAATVDRWLRVFLTRFHRQQFKRTTLPPSPKVGSVSVSPRGDLRMPDEVDPTEIAAWLP
jgi:NAD+ synthase (glutamine-hydrolysing)